GEHPAAEQKQARQINKSYQPAQFGGVIAALRKGERKMQEQSRLQHTCGNVAPEDGPVKGVQLAGVMKRVKNERHQAENIKVGGFGRGPAAEQNIKSDSQVDQGDQALAYLHGIIGRDRDHRRDFNVHTLTVQQISGTRIYSGAIQKFFQLYNVLDGLFFWLAVDTEQPVADFDAGFGARTIR